MANGAKIDQVAGILLLNRWLKALAALLGTDAGCIVVSDANTARVIARHNIPHAFLVTDHTIEKAPYARDETVIVPDARDRHDLHALLGSLALERTGFFYRRPLSNGQTRSIGLLTFGREPRPAITARELALVEELANVMAQEVERYYPADDHGLPMSMNMNKDDLDQWIDANTMPALVLDTDFRLMKANNAMRACFSWREPVPVGTSVRDVGLPAGEGLELLLKQALESGISSPRIDFEMRSGEAEDSITTVRAMASPLHLVGGPPVLVVSFDTTAILPARSPDAIRGDTAAGSGENATVDFLMETLVRRRALRTRKGLSYVTLRSWRQPIRAHQIRALTAIKRNAPGVIAREIAAELHADIASLFGSSAFRAVVAVPCGHSPPGACLSLEIARALGHELSLPVVSALSLPVEPGGSHPRKNATRMPMTLTHAVEGPILLVDDVATSGQHIEEASRLLRGANASVLALAWIGGDSNDPAESED